MHGNRYLRDGSRVPFVGVYMYVCVCTEAQRVNIWWSEIFSRFVPEETTQLNLTQTHKHRQSKEFKLDLLIDSFFMLNLFQCKYLFYFQQLTLDFIEIWHAGILVPMHRVWYSPQGREIMKDDRFKRFSAELLLVSSHFSSRTFLATNYFFGGRGVYVFGCVSCLTWYIL